ncbi:MAG TPA: hypothetical protein VKA08_00595 [Balneolales bacterium]|nr:hypothetical protein [Balneolales bacterium]
MMEINEMQVRVPAMAPDQARDFGTALTEQLAASLPAGMTPRQIDQLKVKAQLTPGQMQEPLLAIPHIVQQIIRQIRLAE